ncbi:MAG: RdgB/HAM1 family non-canonical purine NTP pyrophosphatase [Pseudomonadota bacterium]|nr:RdgB/HAM1 family non-canonical purine NTP pyrophosphatase [Pseudomonadota bacterium]
MVRLFKEPCLVIASHNAGKIAEISALFSNKKIRILSAADLGIPEPEETGASFIENAKLKARAATHETGFPAIADDSGIEIYALDGAPGIYSARWAGQNKDFCGAMRRVQTELGNNPDRRARFVCALALAWPDSHVEVFVGDVEGCVVWPPRGNKGFGYDPMFIAQGDVGTFGEIEPAKKHSKSHRSKAFFKLNNACFSANEKYDQSS